MTVEGECCPPRPWTSSEDRFILRIRPDCDEGELSLLSELLPGRQLTDIRQRFAFLSSTFPVLKGTHDCGNIAPPVENSLVGECEDDSCDEDVISPCAGRTRPGRRNLGVARKPQGRRREERGPARSTVSDPACTKPAEDVDDTAGQASTGVAPLVVEGIADPWWARIRGADVTIGPAHVPVFAGRWMDA